MNNLLLIQDSLICEEQGVTVERQLANADRLKRGLGIDGTSSPPHVRNSQLHTHWRGNR